MAKELNEEVTNHLEFLGYEVEKLEADTGFLYIARAQNKSNLIVRSINNMTIITTRWNGYQMKALKSKDFFEAINTINQKLFTKWFFERGTDKEEVNLVIEATYYDYNRPTFGGFIEGFESEVKTNITTFSDFIIEEDAK